ncbi:MAG: hypothetical protein F4059_10075 [Gemmatimonadetes bacterium]|nr:hypothetical protein [Gemmatimonadota bacterium]
MFGVLGLNPWECTAYYVSERLPACSIAPCRRPVGGGPITSNKPAGPRRYGDDEVRQLLERASELHRAAERENPADGITLADLEEAAAEAGIPSTFVRQAAATLGDPARPPGTGFFKSAGFKSHRIIKADVGVEDLKLLAADLERTLGIGDSLSKVRNQEDWLGRPMTSLYWHSGESFGHWVFVAEVEGKVTFWAGDYLDAPAAIGVGVLACVVLAFAMFDAGFLGALPNLALAGVAGLGMTAAAWRSRIFRRFTPSEIDHGAIVEALVERVESRASRSVTSSSPPTASAG